MSVDKNTKFIFIDEPVNKNSERSFACGFLEIEDPKDFMLIIRRVYDQIFNLSLRKKQKRIDDLSFNKKYNEIVNLSKSFNQFELKYYSINKENSNLYRDFVNILFKKVKFNYTALIIDRKENSHVKNNDPYFLHKECLSFFTKYLNKDYKHIFIPDYSEAFFDWEDNSLLNHKILPLDSRGTVFLQTVDIITGLVLQSFKYSLNIKPTNSEKNREKVLELLENKIKSKIYGDMSVNLDNISFYCKNINFKPKQKRRHGQETQPSLLAYIL